MGYPNLTAGSPWAIVFGCIEDYEDALALSMLFEYRDDDLVANGIPLGEVLGVVPSERPLAVALAEWLNQSGSERNGGNDGWSYTNFYQPTRGNQPPIDPELFRQKCAVAGVELTHIPITVTE